MVLLRRIQEDVTDRDLCTLRKCASGSQMRARIDFTKKTISAIDDFYLLTTRGGSHYTTELIALSRRYVPFAIERTISIMSFAMASLTKISLPMRFARTFSSTASCAHKSTKSRLEVEHSAVPPYPYGPSKWYKQSNFGLYGVQKIQFGNMVSKKNEIKTRRHWRPNVQRKRLYSDALGKFLRVRVTARVLRTIDKCGGLDEYLLGEKSQRIKELGMGGWKLRWRIMQTERVKERFRAQRELLGLPPKVETLIGSDGVPVTPEQVQQEIKAYDTALEQDEDVDIGEEAEESRVTGEFMEEQPAGKQPVTI